MDKKYSSIRSIHRLKVLTFDSNSEKVTIVNEKVDKRPPRFKKADNQKKKHDNKDLVDLGNSDKQSDLSKATKGIDQAHGDMNEKENFQSLQHQKRVRIGWKDIGMINTEDKVLQDNKRKDVKCFEQQSNAICRQPQRQVVQVYSCDENHCSGFNAASQSGDSKQTFTEVLRKDTHMTASYKSLIVDKQPESGELKTSRVEEFFFNRSYDRSKYYNKNKKNIRRKSKKSKDIISEVSANKLQKVKNRNSLYRQNLQKGSTNQNFKKKTLNFNILKRNLYLQKSSCSSRVNEVMSQDALKSRKLYRKKSDNVAVLFKRQPSFPALKKRTSVLRRSNSDNLFGFHKARRESQVMYCLKKKNFRRSKSLGRGSKLALYNEECFGNTSYRLLRFPEKADKCSCDDVIKVSNEQRYARLLPARHIINKCSVAPQITQPRPYKISNRNSNFSKCNSRQSEPGVMLVLRYCFVCLVIIIWLPCLFLVSLCWLFTYPCRPKEKCNKPFCPSFIHWVKTANFEVFKSMFKRRVRADDEAPPLQSRIDNCKSSRFGFPNPNKEYTLAHTYGRGWVMRPLKHISYNSRLCQPFKIVKFPKYGRKCDDDCESPPQALWTQRNIRPGISFEREKQYPSEQRKKKSGKNKKKLKIKSKTSSCICPPQPTKLSPLYYKNCECEVPAKTTTKSAKLKSDCWCPASVAPKQTPSHLAKCSCPLSPDREKDYATCSCPISPDRGKDYATCSCPTSPDRGKDYAKCSCPTSPDRGKDYATCSCPTSPDRGKDYATCSCPTSPDRGKDYAMCSCLTSPDRGKDYATCACLTSPDRGKDYANCSCPTSPDRGKDYATCSCLTSPDRGKDYATCSCPTSPDRGKDYATCSCPTSPDRGKDYATCSCVLPDKGKVNATCLCPLHGYAKCSCSLPRTLKVPVAPNRPTPDRRKIKKKKKKKKNKSFAYVRKAFYKFKKALLGFLKCEKKAWDPEVKCGELYVQTMRNKPCFWLYGCCPGFYPFLLNVCKMYQNCCNVMLYICAACIWMPCMCCCYLCTKVICSC